MPAERYRAMTKQVRKINHMERFNNTLRQRIARLVHGSLAFSKNWSTTLAP
jgi:hypothetical protein